MELLTLGPPRLLADDGEPVALPPKNLALLVFLVVADPGGFQRRDTLLAIFWPELDLDHARNALNQAVYQLRRSIGGGAVVSRGKEELGVASGAIACDAVELLTHLEAGEPEAALARHGGPFLEGFHLSGAPEFERWLDATRARIRSAALRAALELAERAADEEDAGKAHRWLEWARDVAPTDERVVRRLLRHLDRRGERARAIRVYEKLAARLREELRLEPSPETRALVEQIRARSRPYRSARPLPERREISSENPPVPVPTPDTGTGSGAGAEGEEWRVSAALVAAAIVGGGAILALVGWFSSTPEGPPVRPLTVAVLPCDGGGGPDSAAYFAEGFSTEITTEIFRVPGLRVVSPAVVERLGGSDAPRRQIPDSLGIDAVLECSVRRLGDRARVTARLVDGRQERQLWADSYDRRVSDVFALQSDVALAVARALDARLPTAAESDESSSTPPSAEAYDLYLKAAALVNHGQRAEAVRLLKEVVRLEPDFARAWHKLSVQYAHEVLSRGGDLAWADSGIAAGRRARAADPKVGGGGLPFNLVAKGHFSKADSVWHQALDEGSIGIGQLNTWAFFETVRGRCDRAFEITGHARRIDPWANTRWGDALAWSCVGEHDRARDLLQGMIGWNRSMGLPPGPTTLAMLASLEMKQGTYEAAERRIDQLEAHHPGNHLTKLASAKLAYLRGQWEAARRRYAGIHAATPWARDAVTNLSVRARLGTAYLRVGRSDRGRKLLARAEEEARERIQEGSEHPGLAVELALVHAARGAGEKAVRWLERAVDLGWPWRGQLLRDPALDDVREHARYRRVVERLARRQAEMRSRALALRLEDEAVGEGFGPVSRTE